MACVAILAEDVAKLPVRQMRSLPNGGKVAVAPGEHWLARLFREPNDWQTWFEFCEMMMAALTLRSIAHAVIIRDRVSGVPQQLVRSTPTGSAFTRRRAAIGSGSSPGRGCTRWRSSGICRC
jgi:phage portal protein BeeE